MAFTCKPTSTFSSNITTSCIHMVRCDYDALFYRVFCITLLALALTFTLILTNVFVDIDDLILKKDRGVSSTEADARDQVLKTSEDPAYDGVVYDYVDDSYRTKRSLDSSNINIKRILAQKLASLVEEFDQEEHATAKTATEKTLKNFDDILSIQMLKDTERDRTREMFHAALHNLLLNGIIHHTDLRNVYKHSLALADAWKIDNKELYVNSVDPELSIYDTPRKVEEIFFRELVNCVTLHEEVAEHSKLTLEEEKLAMKHKNPKIMIKTIIDIASAAEKPNQNDTNQTENVNGIVKLIYNGKNVRIANSLDDTTSKNEVRSAIAKVTETSATTKAGTTITTTKQSFDPNNIPKSYMDKFVEEYFKRFESNNKTTTEKPQQKRIKRNSKSKYENKGHLNKTKKKDDDELYVEIETHFDSKGLKGERKKKLISGLVKKIEKAIHSNKVEAKRRKHKHVHVKKRLQNPLEQNKVLWLKKISSPISSIIHREVNPLPNLFPHQETILDTADKSREDLQKSYLEYITDKSGESWKMPPIGPGFLNTAKSLNSAENGEVDIDYNRVLSTNGIPQRLQKPLNTDDSDEGLSNVFQDIGNLKFLIKDDGAGLSIGYNQYADEPPDSETMKLFTDLKNIVKTYHQSYDENENLQEFNVEDFKPKFTKDIGSDHTIMRRSIKNEHKLPTNNYKVLYERKYQPYDNYLEVLMNSTTEDGTDKNERSTLTVDDDILEKNLKPAEIFKLANLFQRKKRAMKLNKITNIRTKISKFLNTGSKLKKRIFINKKRSKRQINKIRIIASDIPNIPRDSNENIFLTSDDKIFANRAIVREFNHGINNDYRRKQEDSEEIPFYAGGLTNGPNPSIFGSKSRHNALTSRYPHILLKELSRSKEELHDNGLLFSNIYRQDEIDKNDKTNADLMTSNATENYVQLMNYFDSVMPTKYKLSVKLIPKNATDLNDGFKEVHTSINKSFNKNGLLFSSLVNVSEISQITKVNKTDNNTEDSDANILNNPIQEQQVKMQSLLEQHKTHIDEQLRQLRQERRNLDKILEHTNQTKNNTHYLELVMPENPNKVLHLTKEEVRNIVVKALATAPTTVKPLTTESVTLTTVVKVTDKPKATIDPIEKNERLTQQVLNKIDQNTQLLQDFLRKLTAHLTAAAPQPRFNEPVKVELPKEWKPHPLAVTKFEPTQLNHRNDSHLAIPFVYAYQRPIVSTSNRSSKPNDNVASIVYHGHIHTNTILNKEFKKETEDVDSVKASKEGNQTRFFIDNLVGPNKTKREAIAVSD